MRSTRARLLAALSIAGLAACSEPGPVQPVPAEVRTDRINPSPLPQSVRFVWFVPSDVPFDEGTVEAIRRAAHNTRSWYRAQTAGTTFRLDDDFPVEVVFGRHSSAWYEDRPNPYGWDPVWNANYWVDMEVMDRLSLTDWSPSHKVAIYMSAEGGGGASGGRLVVPRHDVDGIQDGNPNIHRFWGGLAHELGHVFDLPDADGHDGTIMSGALYAYPGAALTGEQLAAMLRSGRNAGYLEEVGPEFDPHAWYLLVSRGTGQVAEVQGADSADGVPVVAADSTGAPAQQWRLEPRAGGTWAIRNRATGKLLVVEDRSPRPGAAIRQWSDDGSAYQGWYVLSTGDGGHEIVAPHGIVANQGVQSLDLASAAAGAPLVQRGYRTAATQGWRLVRQPAG